MAGEHQAETNDLCHRRVFVANAMHTMEIPVHIDRRSSVKRTFPLGTYQTDQYSPAMWLFIGLMALLTSAICPFKLSEQLLFRQLRGGTCDNSPKITNLAAPVVLCELRAAALVVSTPTLLVLNGVCVACPRSIRAMAPITLSSAIFNATLSVAILYGAYAALFMLAMFLLISRERTRQNINLMVITVIMFAMSSTHAAVVIRYANVQFLDKDAARDSSVLQRRGDPMVYIPTIFEIINCYIADAIVFWRAWVLWGKTTRCLVIPSFLWMATIGEGIGVIHALAGHAPGETASLTATSIASWTVAFSATTCFSNFWAVCMIGYRYHIYRTEVISTLGSGQASLRTLLVLIIESGVLYCMSWLLFIIVYMAGSQGMYIVMHSLAQLTGIYPTMIIVLVCLRATQQDEIERFHTTIQFARSRMICDGQSCHIRSSQDIVHAIPLSKVTKRTPEFDVVETMILDRMCPVGGCSSNGSLA